MRRVMVVGQPGSGKSTFALALGERAGLPVVHLDRLHWRAGWVERSTDERARLFHEAEQREAWIAEGFYARTWDTRAARADLLIWLDRPAALRLWRVIRRQLRGLGRTRPDLPDGCPELLRNLPSFVAFIWRTRRSDRARLAHLVAEAPCPVARLSTDREVAAFLLAAGAEPALPLSAASP